MSDKVRQHVTIMMIGGGRWTTDLSVESTIRIIEGMTQRYPVIKIPFKTGEIWEIRVEAIAGLIIKDYEKVNVETRRRYAPPAKSRKRAI
jgi:hypothetical protein